MKYRPEIDGLRAVAVIPVILFHAGFETFGGGFIGVDVFFVISGYLITSIIIEDIENNRFSLSHFYERRVRRILPALFLVMLASIPLAWMWMLPNQMKEFSQSLVAVSVFASNFFFWIKSGYFDSAAEEKPLLHTWSLAVEEQYYLVFPIFLLIAWRFGKIFVCSTLLAVALVSLGLTEWGWRNIPSANFYFIPTRAWELLSGSFAAIFVQKYGVRANNPASIAGLCAILSAFFFFDRSVPIPSTYGLMPVTGVVLLLLFAESNTFAAKILSKKALVGIGLISYSAYLWHQPLFAFARIRNNGEPSSSLMLLLSIVAIILAILTWRYVEQPFRTGKKFFQKRYSIFCAAALGAFFFVAIGLLGHLGLFESAMGSRYSQLAKQYGGYEYAGVGWGWIEEVEKPAYLLVGDSHAKQYYGSLQKKLDRVSMYAHPACLSLPNLVNQYDGQNIQRKDCINFHQKYLDYLDKSPSIKRIFITHRWEKNLYDLSTSRLLGKAREDHEARQVFIDNLLKLISLLPKRVQITVIGDVPSARAAGPNMKKGFIHCKVVVSEGECQLTYPRAMREGIWINTLLAELEKREARLLFFDPGKALCNTKECMIVRNGTLLYSDHAHLTKHGADLVIEKLVQ